MGKNKLQKFADIASFDNVIECTYKDLSEQHLSGKWHQRFGNENPIILELGCGYGEYTVGLSQRFPFNNYIGVDIKGCRLWHGAKEALKNHRTNVLFLRTQIAFLPQLFAPNEIDEIWLPFCDPQQKKVNKRLTSTTFLEQYTHFLKPNGLIHLKTDSPFLYTYTRSLIEINHFPLITYSENIYMGCSEGVLTDIRTHYEEQWLSRGMQIKYLCWQLPHRDTYLEPAIDIIHDDYKSYKRFLNSTETS